jgi:exodeoxyribonuclease VII small subunit
MAKQKSDKEKELSFEEALERLEGVVDQLEQGELALEASIEAFELGVRLSKRCASQLEDAEQRVEVLTREGEKWQVRPFEAEGPLDDEVVE